VEHPDLHQSARFAYPFDTASAAERQYRAVTDAAGVCPLEERLVIRVVGEDRVSFMQGMCSDDIQNLAPGRTHPALFLTEHAHVIADFNAWAAADALLLEIDRAFWEPARRHLERLLVADDVEMEELDSLGVVDIEGPRASDVIRAIGDGTPPPELWHHVKTDAGFVVGNIPRFGGSAFTILIEKARVADVIERLRNAPCGFAVDQVDGSALDIIRVENGLARVGIDTDEKTIALEARLERAISFNKGCYLGQETIERATARGALKKRLYGLRFERGRLPQSGAAVLLDGKQVGRVTSAVLSPRLGPLGLSILHHSAWTAGTRVTVKDSAGELAAFVSQLPFK
jgi:folate-binding protein YgfZ